MKPSKFPHNPHSRQWTLHEATTSEPRKLDPCLLLTALFDFLHGRLDSKLAALEQSDQTQKKSIEDCLKQVRKLKTSAIELKEEKDSCSSQPLRSRTPGKIAARAADEQSSPIRKPYSKCSTPVKDPDPKKTEKPVERPPWVSTRQVPVRSLLKKDEACSLARQPARPHGPMKPSPPPRTASPELTLSPADSKPSAGPEKQAASKTIDVEILPIPTFQESSVTQADNCDALQQNTSILDNLFDLLVKPNSVRCDKCGHNVDLAKALAVPGERQDACLLDSQPIPKMAPSDFIHIANANSVIVGSPAKHDTFNPAFSDPNSLWVEIERKRQELLLLLEEVGTMSSRAYTFRQDSVQKPRPSLQVQPVLVTKCDNIGPASDASSRHSSPAKTFKAASPAKRSMKIYEGFEAKVMKGGRASCREDLDCRDKPVQEAPLAVSSLRLVNHADAQRDSETPKPAKTPGAQPLPLVARLPGVGYQSPYKAPKPEPKSPKPQKENRQPAARLPLTNPLR